MKLSKKIKDLREKIQDEEIQKELTALISDAMNLEAENEILNEEKKQSEKTKPEEEKKDPELTYRTGPNYVEVSYGKEKAKTDFRTSLKVAGKVHSYIFSGISETEPEKEKGKTFKKLEVGNKTVFVIYSK